MTTDPGTRPLRHPVRSFVRRAGRVTRAQAQALDCQWSRYGVDGDGPLDFAGLFHRTAPCEMEIGFGMGDALAAMATARPECNFLGVEVHEAGIGRLLHLAATAGVDNLRIVRGDAVTVLHERLAPGVLAAILVFFPDPWPKKRHHKRRLIQPDVTASMARALAPGARLHLATDWAPYAQQMLEVVEADGRFRNRAGVGRFAPGPGNRPATRFERRGARLGHVIVDLEFERVAGSVPA